MDDSHEMKNCMGKAAGHHKMIAGHHEDMAKACHGAADAMKTEVDAMKALASDWGGVAIKAADGTPITSPTAGGGVEAMLQETSSALLKKTLLSFDTDPEVANFVREFALKQMTAALGSKIVPDHVRGVITQFPNNGTLVPRAGAPNPNEKIDVPLQFEKAFSIED
jgi:hypothetical protein